MNWKKVVYWVITVLLSLVMVANGIAKLAGAEELVANMTRMGFPPLILPILGIWYLLVPAGLLAPWFPRLREWTYAGITFVMTSAVAVHVLHGDPMASNIPALVLLGFTAISYVLQPRPQPRTEMTAPV